MNKTTPISSYFIAGLIITTLAALFIGSLYFLVQTIFYDQDYLFQSLSLLGITFCSIILCACVILLNDNSERVNLLSNETNILKKQIIILVDHTEKLTHEIVRLSLSNRSSTTMNIFDFINNPNTSSTIEDAKYAEDSKDISNLDDEEIKTMLEDALAREDYDTAAQLRDELNRRK